MGKTWRRMFKKPTGWLPLGDIPTFHIFGTDLALADGGAVVLYGTVFECCPPSDWNGSYRPQFESVRFHPTGFTPCVCICPSCFSMSFHTAQEYGPLDELSNWSAKRDIGSDRLCAYWIKPHLIRVDGMSARESIVAGTEAIASIVKNVCGRNPVLETFGLSQGKHSTMAFFTLPIESVIKLGDTREVVKQLGVAAELKWTRERNAESALGLLQRVFAVDPVQVETYADFFNDLCDEVEESEWYGS